MGKIDIAVKEVLRRKSVFADLMNGTIYEGRQVLTAADLEMLPVESGLFYKNKKEKANALERRGDVRMKADIGTYCVILAAEHQDKVHYAMAVRAMLYDALEYTRQVKDIEKEHSEAGDKLEGNEFLSGITKEDRLMPVITMILYTGAEWDGARSLYEMLELGSDENGELIKRYLPDYRLNLIDVNKIEDVKVFQSCLQQIFSMVRLRKDKEGLYEYLREHEEELERFDSVERTAALVLLGEPKRLEKTLNKKEGEEWKLCEAIDELIRDGELRGEKRGEKIGEKIGEKRGERRGEKRGRKKGEKIGKIKGENRMAQLAVRLMKEKRYDDMERAAKDADYRVGLYQEYGI